MKHNNVTKKLLSLIYRVTRKKCASVKTLKASDFHEGGNCKEDEIFEIQFLKDIFLNPLLVSQMWWSSK